MAEARGPGSLPGAVGREIHRFLAFACDRRMPEILNFSGFPLKAVCKPYLSTDEFSRYPKALVKKTRRGLKARSGCTSDPKFQA